MTLNLPVTYARIRLILLVGEYLVQPILFTSKQVHSYVAKLFTSGIT